MDEQKAIDIMQEHIESYHYQMSDKGWNEMIKSGIVGSESKKRLEFKSYAAEHIEAYELAIAALKERETYLIEGIRVFLDRENNLR